MFSYKTSSPEETSSLGLALACYIEHMIKSNNAMPFVAMYGDLGVGKTEFTRGFVSQLSPGSRVKSPTYTIVNEYLKGKIPVYHFDFYRIENPAELNGIGFEDYTEKGICIAEWCERLKDSDLPKDIIEVHIARLDDSSRRIEIHGAADFELYLQHT